jgi:hypothetical protein
VSNVSLPTKRITSQGVTGGEDVYYRQGRIVRVPVQNCLVCVRQRDYPGEYSATTGKPGQRTTWEATTSEMRAPGKGSLEWGSCRSSHEMLHHADRSVVKNFLQMPCKGAHEQFYLQSRQVTWGEAMCGFIPVQSAKIAQYAQ